MEENNVTEKKTKKHFNLFDWYYKQEKNTDKKYPRKPGTPSKEPIK